MKFQQKTKIWKGAKGLSKRKVEKGEITAKKLRGRAIESFDFMVLSASQNAQTNKLNLYEERGWTQYKPWIKDENRKNRISINMATIHGIAKRMMAREWAKALGKKPSFGFESLKREALSRKRRNKFNSSRR